MKSNKCLFNKAIFKSDIKRFLPFTLPLLIVDLIIFPVIIYSNFKLPNDPLEIESFTGMSVAADMFSYFFAGVFALLVFSYVYRPNTCNALHAFPVGRRGLFVTSFLAGYVLLTVPQVIGFAVSIPGIYTTSKEFTQIILLQFVSIFAESFIAYSIGVLAVFLAGNLFGGAALYILLNSGVAIIQTVVSYVITKIGAGILFDDSILDVPVFSPMLQLSMTKAELLLDYSFIEEFGGTSVAPTVGDFYKQVLIYLAASLVIIALAYVFYKIRKLEVAGDMVAFKIEYPIIGIIVSFIGGSLLTLFVSIFISVNMIGWLVMFVLFSFAAFIIAEMILHKTAKVFTLKNIILWAVFCAVTVSAFALAANYKTNLIPNTADIEKMTVNCTYEMTIDEKDYEQAEKFHKALLENEKKKDKSQENYGLFDLLFASDRYLDGMIAEYSVSIEYTLKDGKRVSRWYSFKETDTELLEMLGELEEKYHPESVFDMLEGIKFEITSIGVSSWNWNGDEVAPDYYDIPKESYEEVYEKLRQGQQKRLDGYRSQAEMPYYGGDLVEDTYDDNKTYYDVRIEGTVRDKESLEKFKELDEYLSDPSGTYFAKETWYEYVENSENYVCDSFSIEFNNLEADSEIMGVLSSFRKLVKSDAAA